MNARGADQLLAEQMQKENLARANAHTAQDTLAHAFGDFPITATEILRCRAEHAAKFERLRARQIIVIDNLDDSLPAWVAVVVAIGVAIVGVLVLSYFGARP